MSLRVKCNLSTDLAILKLWCNGQKFGREHVTSGTKRERLDVCGGAQSSQLKPQACARARACVSVFLCPPPHPAPPNRHLWIGYRSYETGLRDPGFPPFLSENVMLMFAYVYVVCFHGVVHCVTKTQILLRNHRRHHRRVSNLRHNQIVMMHLSIQRQRIAGYTVTSVRPSRQRKALCHLCAFFLVPACSRAVRKESLKRRLNGIVGCDQRRFLCITGSLFSFISFLCR